METTESLPQPERETAMVRVAFGDRMKDIDWEQIDQLEIIAAAREIQFAMDDILIPEILDTFGIKGEQEEYVGSAFDEYDREQGYEDEKPGNVWTQWTENVNALISSVIRQLRESYTGALNAPLFPLLDFLEFEMKKS